MDINDFDNLGTYDKQKVLENAKNHDDNFSFLKLVKLSVAFFVVLIASVMAGCPQYNVWSEGLKGQAELKRAEQNRQIQIEEAIALKESATYRRDAEIIRAEGVDGANKIIAGGLGGAQGYLRYLYIDALQSTNCQTIYIPTEAGLPILEARSFK